LEDKKKGEVNNEDNFNNKAFPLHSPLPLSTSPNTSDKRNKTISTSAWISLAILGSSILITMYGETMLLPAIPDIIREFNISYNTASWILTAYLIAGAVMTPIGGKLSDIYGRKKMVLIIMVIYIIGISLGGLSSNITFLIISRIIQGIGIAMFPIAFGIVRDQFPPEKLAIGVGTFSAMFAAGSVVGLAIGASVIQNLGWRATFFSIIPISILLWIIIKKFIYDKNNTYQPEHPSPIKSSCSQKNSVIAATASEEQKNNVNNSNHLEVSASSSKSIDIKGAITLAVTITSFLIVLSYFETSSDGEGLGRDDAKIITPTQTITGFFIAGIVSLILFIIIEKSAIS
jgi:MFS family permease